MLPSSLKDVVTPEEYQTYLQSQRALEQDPQMQALKKKRSALYAQLRQLGADRAVLVQQLLQSDPAMLALTSKITEAIKNQFHLSTPPQ